MTNKIAFPGIGIDSFTVNREAFTLTFGDNSFSVYWYGVIITCGIIFAFFYAMYRAKNEGVKPDYLLDVGIWTVVLGVVGARLYYVLTSLDHFLPKPFNFIEFLKNVVNLRTGGLAIYGGIIGGIIGIFIASRIKKINFLKLTDMIGPGVGFAQAMGRWGNFFNGEAFGGIVEEGHPLYFLRMGLISDNTVNTFNTTEMVYVHPTFFYESLWNVVGFIIISCLNKKKKFNGQIACMYLAWYGFGRMFIEGLRTDSLYVGSFRISQVVGFLCFIVFGALLVWGLIYSRRFVVEGIEETKTSAYLKPSYTHYTFAQRIDDIKNRKKNSADEEKTAPDNKDSTECSDESKENTETENTEKEDKKDGENN